MFTKCCCALALVSLSYLLLYNLIRGCKVEVQYGVRNETYGEVSNEGKGQEEEDEKAEMAGKEAPKTARSALKQFIFQTIVQADNK